MNRGATVGDTSRGVAERLRCVTMAALWFLLALGAAEALAEEHHYGILELNPTISSRYVQPGETVVVRLDVAQLEQAVKACQAFLAYESLYLEAVSVVPGGGDWDELIYEHRAIAGDVDMAVGVLGQTTPGAGTVAEGTVAIVTFLAKDHDGVTQVDFRPNLGDLESTFLSNLAAEIVWPTTANSPSIIVDGTPPVVQVVAATQVGRDLLAGDNAIQGTGTIVVEATDALAGLVGPPEVEVTLADGTVEAATFIAEGPAGRYRYEWSVDAGTPNGPAAIAAVAEDRAGNIGGATGEIRVNKNRITGTIELDRFDGSAVDFSRLVTFVASGATTRSQEVTVVGFSNHMADYVVDDVPDLATRLSAKTAWNLRRRLTVTLDADGQASGVDFVGPKRLLGGDLNGDNLVNLQDYARLKLAWLTAEPSADIDGDGMASVFDYVIMKLAWYLAGEPQ